MRLSEMSNEQTRAAMIRLAAPLGNIADDEDMVKLLDEYKAGMRLPLIVTVGRILPKLISYAFDKHYDDLLEIVAVFAETTREKAARMKFKDTVQVIRENYDDLLASFFTSSATAGGNGGKGS